MNDVWVMVLLVGVATFAVKSAGPLALGGRRLPARLEGAVELLAPALLSAMVVTQAFAAGDELTLDARALGLAAAVVAIALRAPVMAVVVIAAAVTAVGRL